MLKDLSHLSLKALLKEIGAFIDNTTHVRFFHPRLRAEGDPSEGGTLLTSQLVPQRLSAQAGPKFGFLVQYQEVPAEGLLAMCRGVLSPCLLYTSDAADDRYVV